MTLKKSFLEGKKILTVDDEPDVLDTIQEILEKTHVDKVRDHATALKKLSENKYDLVILDIMGVDGLKLLEKSVEKGFPTVMLTAHAFSVDTLMASIRLGAISFLPKQKLAEIDQILEELLAAHADGKPTWKTLFDRLGDFFDEKFGPDWKDKDKEFWSKFSRTYNISKGIQSRLAQDEKVKSRGI